MQAPGVAQPQVAPSSSQHGENRVYRQVCQLNGIACPVFMCCLVSMCCSYMYLGMTLHQLDDVDNAAAAFDKAVSLDPSEPLLHLNYGEGTVENKRW